MKEIHSNNYNLADYSMESTSGYQKISNSQTTKSEKEDDNDVFAFEVSRSPQHTPQSSRTTSHYEQEKVLPRGDDPHDDLENSFLRRAGNLVSIVTMYSLILSKLFAGRLPV